MNKDRAKGTAKEAVGRVQQAAGSLTGNEKQQAKGKGKELEGKVQKGIGKVKDAGRAAADKLH